jgi:Zn-finger nucleic acid-binding protein
MDFLLCPKCPSVELERPERGGKVKRPYSCNQCGGMWLTPREVDYVIENAEAASLIQPENGETPVSEMDKKAGSCPHGHGILIRAKIDVKSPFYLEKCAVCGGIWFDKGEWRRLAESHLVQNLREFWTSAWQKKQREAEYEEVYKEWQKRMFGDQLQKQLLHVADLLRNHPKKSEAIAFLREEVLGEKK